MSQNPPPLPHQTPPPLPQYVQPAGESAISGLIPYKNSRALIAYYLGVFSLIPAIGAPLGVTAFILGILGVKYANRHPEAKGKVHAWVGIVLGGLCGFAQVGIIVTLIVAAVLRETHHGGY